MGVVDAYWGGTGELHDLFPEPDEILRSDHDFSAFLVPYLHPHFPNRFKDQLGGIV